MEQSRLSGRSEATDCVEKSPLDSRGGLLNRQVCCPTLRQLPNVADLCDDLIRVRIRSKGQEED